MKGATNMSRGRFEIVRTDAGYHVRTVGANGETLSNSETLSTFESAVRNVEAQVEIAQAGVDLIARVDERGDGS
jgi:hypothetical protein